MDWEKLKPSRMGFFDEALMQVPYDGAKNVVCPMCGTLIQVDAIGNSRDVHCQMKDCFCLEEFDTRRF